MGKGGWRRSDGELAVHEGGVSDGDAAVLAVMVVQRHECSRCHCTAHLEVAQR